ncbi:MAG: type IIA DNA topoisomerase subunit B [Myxococcales bacterium]|nr:type IIA DNA topoisomerase subunit B [Myxococcales bacterium]
MAHTSRNKKYDSEDIRVLEGLEPVRVRPGMYIGGTDSHGYHHLLREILDNSIDEVINGHAHTIQVTLDENYRGVTIEDDGRGIPIAKMKKYKKPALEVILTTLHAGGKFDGGSYDVSGGLHGVGSSVVNALSEEMNLVIRRDGYEWSQQYARGLPITSLKKGKASRKHGTSVHFRPDPEIFGPKLKFDTQKIKDLLDAKAYLHPEVTIHYESIAEEETAIYHHPGGLKDFLPKVINETKRTPTHPEPFIFSHSVYPRTEVILSWTDGTTENILSYANGVRTGDGGSHELGLKQAVVKAVRAYMKASKRNPKGVTITAEDIREGVIIILSVYIREPQFQGQTKGRLNNPECQPLVESMVYPALEQWLLHNPTTADQICYRVETAARAREASRAAAAQVQRKSAVSHRLNLPGKLHDCSSTNPANSELFIVEGDSAGGTAKQGRDRSTQAVLPLRGKIINTMQSSLSKVLENKEIGNIVSALGCGIGPKLDLSKLRYERIFLLMDADPDGHHIATLVLTFFMKHMPELVEHGHIYLAQPPLYKIEAGKEVFWALDDGDKDRILKKLPKNVKPSIMRFKGLGEMNAAQLKTTTLAPKTRRALRVQLDEDSVVVMQSLMGKDPQPRYHFIMERAEDADADALDY